MTTAWTTTMAQPTWRGTPLGNDPSGRGSDIVADAFFHRRRMVTPDDNVA